MDKQEILELVRLERVLTLEAITGQNIAAPGDADRYAELMEKVENG